MANDPIKTQMNQLKYKETQLKSQEQQTKKNYLIEILNKHILPIEMDRNIKDMFQDLFWNENG